MKPLRTRLAIGLLALAIPLLPCGFAAASAAPGKDVNLALRLNDMPTGFTMSLNKRWSNAAAAARDGLPASAYSSRGRVASYETSFKRDGLFGILLIDDSVASYHTSEGAQWIFTRNVGLFRTTVQYGKHWQAMSAPAVGNKSRALSVTAKHRGYTYTYQAILLRRGDYYAFIEVAGLAGTFDASQLVRLSRILDHRIQVQG